jgi:hypothetical protein
MEQVNFHFKAATGFGTVIDGSVASTSQERVARDLVRQGLIPVRIWPEQPAKRALDARIIARLIGGWLGRFRASLHIT